MSDTTSEDNILKSIRMNNYFSTTESFDTSCHIDDTNKSHTLDTSDTFNTYVKNKSDFLDTNKSDDTNYTLNTNKSYDTNTSIYDITKSYATNYTLDTNKNYDTNYTLYTNKSDDTSNLCYDKKYQPKNKLKFHHEDITKNSVDITNIGGPPMPIYQGCSSSMPSTRSSTNFSMLSTSQKQQAFETAVQTTGYNLFDLTKITNASLDNTKQIVNNTSFYVFLSLFLILIILLLTMIYYNVIDTVVGIYLIVLFSIIIYIMSVLYRFHTLSQSISSTNVINQDIVANQVQYENSLAMQSQMVLNMMNTLS
jgi:hypothetical protein